MRPKEQVKLCFTPTLDGSLEGDLQIAIKGLWIETIVYEIPLLALTSEAYFKFCNKDWDHDGQEEKAFKKCLTLLEHGCLISEFGSRRRRDYKTHDLVLKGLCKASKRASEAGWKGKLTGTSNVHFAMKYGIPPVGTVAHEWYMGIAAINDNYENVNEMALRYWLGTFGEGVRLNSICSAWWRSTDSVAGAGYRTHRHLWNPCFLRSIQAANTSHSHSIAWGSSNIGLCGFKHDRSGSWQP
jgi:nicotinate phosphoribosyltransferase